MPSGIGASTQAPKTQMSTETQDTKEPHGVPSGASVFSQPSSVQVSIVHGSPSSHAPGFGT